MAEGWYFKPGSGTGGGGGGGSGGTLAFTPTDVTHGWGNGIYDSVSGDMIFYGVNIGDATSDRFAVFFLSMTSNSLSNGTIARVRVRATGAADWSVAVDCTNAGMAGTDSTAGLMSYLWYAALPPATLSATTVDVRIQVLYAPTMELTAGRITGSTGTTLSAVQGKGYQAGTTYTDPKSVSSVTVPTGGVVVALASVDFTYDDTVVNSSWSNATKIIDTQYNYGTGQGGFWHCTAYGTSGSPAVTVGGTTNKQYSMIVASFAP